MLRRLVLILLPIALLTSCAGPAKLAERSQNQLAEGDHWKAWNTATRALEKAPANAAARSAATAAATSITDDWHRRIVALAAEDSLAAAEQVLALAAFRAQAARWVTLTPPADRARVEQALRRTAARTHYDRGVTALAAKRPKRAWWEWNECERFVSPWRDASTLAERAYQKGLAHVALLPLNAGDPEMGREVATLWRDALAPRLGTQETPFTRMLGADAAEKGIRLAQLGRISRADAARLGRENGAERVVWGEIGDLDGSTELQVFKDRVARRVSSKDADGRTVTRWVEVPIEVVARVRHVTVNVDCEVLSTRNGAVLAHQRIPRSRSARVVWTSYVPEGDLGAYALVSDEARSADPARARQLEARWKAVCGDGTTLRSVLEARRRTEGSGQYEPGSLRRLLTGAAFVFLSDLPPATDLAAAALADGWSPLYDELARLDAMDDVDLAAPVAETTRR
ncbi:MAG: hypothetical protein U0704_12755 [Candidatus Eisenbacteria bacterium]